MSTFWVIVIIIAGIAIWGYISKQNKLKQLKENYDNSLKGTDKKVALDAGRAYYSALRKDKKLTIYDEQAITNDLSTMKTN
jgi:hypothetical protein